MGFGHSSGPPETQISVSIFIVQFYSTIHNLPLPGHWQDKDALTGLTAVQQFAEEG